MKKFKFSLDTVLVYKQQVLDALRGEHAVILAQVREQEQVLEEVWGRYRSCDEEYRERKMEGLTIVEATLYQNGLRALELEIQRETDKLEALRRKEEQKRSEVVEAKKDTASLEKLREKKLDQYNKAVQKDEETVLEEFVTTTRINQAASA